MTSERTSASSPTRSARRRLAQIERILQRAQIDEYVVVERKHRQVRVTQQRLRSVHAVDQRELEVTLHRDLRRGRASATFVVFDDSLDAIDSATAAAAARASHGLGPAWRLPPPAAPAHVDVADSVIVADPEGVALASVEQLLRSSVTRAKQGWAPASVQVVVEVRTTTVLTSTGFVRTKTESFLKLDAMLENATTNQHLRRCARRREDLNIESLLTQAGRKLRERGTAKTVAPGRYDVVLELDAIVDTTITATGPKQYGWFAAFAALADAENRRRGLARYDTGADVFDGRKIHGDRITLASDGTLPFGWQSSPFGDQGEATRSFTLIKSGIADQPALNSREAGLRKQQSNGGIRNLVLAAGQSSMAALVAADKRSVLRVVEMATLDTDPLTGDFSALLGLSYALVAGRWQPVVGGYLRGNLFDLFANARLARQTGKHTWYAGPKRIRFEDVKVH